MAIKKSNTKLIPAIGYLRKSTKGEDADGKQRQEKSIPQQKREITQLAKDRYKIVDWAADPGISGWKRGAKRPDFQRMLDRARERGDFQAVLCDNLDRFSRASVDEVQEDVLALKRTGVRWIVTAAQGTFDLGRSGHDIGEIMKFVVAVWSAHEFSRQLGRRISLARRNHALEGKRSGGPVPYGLAQKGKNDLQHGDPEHIKTVRWIFDRFANRHRSMCSISRELNEQDVPSPKGKKWSAVCIKNLLTQPAYRGDFRYNNESHGQFFHVDESHEVVESSTDDPVPGPKRLIKASGRYKPLVPTELFDATQKRLATISRDRKPRDGGYPLSGVLYCGHCKRKMAGWKPANKRLYRCSTGNQAAGSCKCYSVAERDILPFIIGMLAEEIHALIAGPQAAGPPDPLSTEAGKRENLEQQKAELAERIDRAENSMMECTDKESRRSIDAKIVKMRAELREVETELTAPVERDRGELDRLTAWWEEFRAKAVKVPLDPSTYPNTVAYLQGFGEEPHMLIDPATFNQMLIEAGCEITLRWRTMKVKRSSGKTVDRHELVGGRLRLGQKTTDFTRKALKGTACRSSWSTPPWKSSTRRNRSLAR